jgi:ribosomal protein L17
VKKRRFADALERALLSEDGTKLRTLAEKLISLAEAGDLAAIREIADRLEGKPSQSMGHSGRLTLEELVAASFASPTVS